MTRKMIFLIGAVLLLMIGFSVWAGVKSAQKRAELAVLIKDVKATVAAGSTCGCCKLYAKYLQDLGFDVDFQPKTQSELEAYKDANNIPKTLRSCHTTRIGKYIVEGHIPIEAIEKLLKEQPDVAGIGMAGMPSSSPGMPGPKTGPFIINTITKDGQKGDLFLKM